MDNYRYYLREKYEFTPGTWVGIGLAVWTIGGILGFIYELIFYWANSDFQTFYWRGGTFGPWLDAYCIASLFIYLVLYRLRRQPWFVVLIGGVACALVQLLVGYGMYSLMGGARAWNCNLEILNYGSIGGFVCLRTVIEYAVLSLLIIYVVVPLVFHMACSVRPGTFIAIWVIIGLICVADIVYNDIVCLFLPGLTSASDVYRAAGLQYMSY